MNNKKLMIASVAPSFPVFFNCHPFQFVTALKTIGFDYVEETVSVLPEIVNRRKEAMKSLQKPLISESCPRVTKLILKEYSHLVNNIAPVPSPMELHGNLIKKKYGQKSFSVFISPCPYKKQENADKKAFDKVITFKQLQKCFRAKLNQPLNKLQKTNFDCEVPFQYRMSVLHINIGGVKQCQEYLSKFNLDGTSNFVEMVYCPNGCITKMMNNINSITPSEMIFKAWEEFM